MLYIAKGLVVRLNQHPYNNFSNYRMFSIVSPLRNHEKKALKDNEFQVKQTVIGNDVWIGMDVTIKDGVTIGDGAVIGSKSMEQRMFYRMQ